MTTTSHDPAARLDPGEMVFHPAEWGGVPPCSKLAPGAAGIAGRRCTLGRGHAPAEHEAHEDTAGGRRRWWWRDGEQETRGNDDWVSP